ncbi:ATP-dependent zinc metalloprotease FtsH [Thermosulfurimonas sp. F29]|uniref:ATP-dependent zinc metalloprotease FtsH n=1 Tax=Thermosulfurimonas sp. F29 TaxID=2867247 RepID=UPI002107F47F|nr:ATP-dependent zinc metalloprotease FtsH [Thermosulfurimonas sp. F29]
MLLILIILFFNSPEPANISYNAFLEEVRSGHIEEVHIHGSRVEARDVRGHKYIFYKPNNPDFIPFLRRYLVKIYLEGEPRGIPFWGWILLGGVLVGVLFLIFNRRPVSFPSQFFSFVRSRARLIRPEEVKVSFQDVAGVEEAKEELREVVEFLKDPHKFTRLGGRMPKGILLVGPPGTGKTLLARAIAGEAGVPFFSISGSDFVEVFVGVGAARVRDLFVQAKKYCPCIIFIDEIDAVGRHRMAAAGGGHEEREQTLNQLLVEMDGFESQDGIVVIAATNRPDILDPALLRPGRFDRRVEVPPPDLRGREAILRVHARRIPLAPDVDLAVVAKSTPGFTGADLANLLNEAALLAARQGKDRVDMEDIERAKDKILLGRERKGIIITEEEKQLAAYHEAGHALIAYLLPGVDPIYKVSIIPRSRTLGVLQQLPIDERHVYPRDYLIKKIMILLGGRVAEEYVFGQASTGAGDDLEKAVEIARKMVCEWGMSDNLGPLVFPSGDYLGHIARGCFDMRGYSEETARKIDKEVENIVRKCYEKDRELLGKHIKYLHILAETLLEEETLDGETLKKLLSDLEPLKNGVFPG